MMPIGETAGSTGGGNPFWKVAICPGFSTDVSVAVVADVPEGNYSVSVEAAGFKKEIRDNVAVTVNTTSCVDVQLQLGSITQQIEVTASPCIDELPLRKPKRGR